MTAPLYECSAIDGGRVWCGPAAIMAVTGRQHDEVVSAINTVRCRKPRAAVKGLYVTELKAAMDFLGFRLDGYSYQSGSPTFAKWLKRKRQPNDVWIVNLTTHYVVVAGRRFIDNHTKVPVALSDAPRKRARVRSVYRVVKV